MKWALVFLVCAGCASVSPRNARKAQLHLQIGVSNLQQGNNPQALTELLAAEKLDPHDANIQQYVAMAYTVREHYAEAEDHYLKALRINSRFTEARYNYALMLGQAHRYNDALAQLRLAAEDLTFGKPEQVLTSMGYIYFQKHAWEKAKKTLAQSLSLKQNDCTAQNLYGRTQFEQKDYDEAARTLDIAVKTCRDLQYDEPLFYSGLSYFKLGDRKNAQARLESLLKSYDNGPYGARARVLLEMLK